MKKTLLVFSLISLSLFGFSQGPSSGNYCTPVTNNDGDHGENFTTTNAIQNFIDDNNAVVPGSYIDYHLVYGVMENAGESFDFSVDFKGNNVDYAIWIDWNQDDIFDISERVYSQFHAGQDPVITGTITIPIDIELGSYRMRVRGAFGPGNGDLDPCATYDWGEVRDYEVIIPSACDGTPIAGTVTDINVCPDVSFTMATDGVSGGETGLTYQWEESADGSSWTDIADANSATYSMTDGVVEGAFYRLTVTCDNSQETAISDAIEVIMNPSSECYCIPSADPTGRLINSFSTTGGTQQISNLNTGYSAGGYGDFTALVAEQIKGSSISVSASVSGGTAGVRVWVDWNQNGTFESDEVAYASSTYLNTQNGTIDVPLDALSGETRMRVVSHWTSMTGDADPCETGFTYGEFEDYTFNVIALPSCTGTPDAGTVADFAVCADEAFDLFTDGASSGEEGLTYQWQESDDGTTWVDIVDGNTISYTVTDGISEITHYRLLVTCDDSGETATSDGIEVSIKTIEECYCIPTYSSGCNLDDVIDDFVLNGENGTSIEDLGTGCSAGSYDDKTADFTPVDLLEGTSYDAGIKTHAFGDNAAIWIDFNDDGNFDFSEKVGSGSLSSDNLTNINIDIPLGANIGIHRMRVVLIYGSAEILACGSFGYGETHDYFVNVVALDGCSGTPEAGTVADFAVCADVAFDITTDGASTGESGFTYQWQESADGTTWTDMAGANTASYTVTDGVAEEGYYRLIVTCDNSGESATSDAIYVTINAPADCYCTPEGTNSGRHINDFTTTGGTQNITNTGSGFSTGGYGDFTAMTVEQVQNGTVDFTAAINGGSAGFRVWVDWNQNGTFEASEVAYSSSSYLSSHTGSFTVPNDALTGTTRMRIVSHWLSTTGDVDPCETGFSYGEFEDYTFNVTEDGGVDCSAFEASIDGDAEICEGDEIMLTVTASDDIASVEWGDGETGTELVVSDAGTYTATVTSVDGCEATVSFEVTVNPLPTVDGIDVTDNGSGSFDFAPTNAVNADTYAWDFGDGETSTDENPTHVYTDEGTYTVTLTVSNDCGSVEVTQTVTYIDGVDCSTFEASIDGDAEICEGDETMLTVTASEDIASVEWGDGETGTELVVSDAGTYTATVTSVDGCETTVSFEVTVNPLPTVDGIDVTDNGNGSYDFAPTNAVNADTYAWDFGDGETSADENPTHVYADEGEYTVTLTVSNDCGSVEVTETVTYEVEVDCSTFEASIDGDAEICEGEVSTLTVTASADIASVEWDNDETGTELVVTDAGTYTATVTSVDGCEATVSFEVTVNPLPTVDGIDVTDNGDGSYDFAPTNAANTDTYVWDFGDGETSSDENPTHVYTDEGTYTVTLTVSNDCGSVTVTETLVYEVSGLDEHDLINLSLFPNPANAYINVVNESAFEMELIVVVSPIGQMVFNGKVNGNNYQLDVSQYATGLYHVNIILNNGDVIQRNFEVIK